MLRHYTHDDQLKQTGDNCYSAKSRDHCVCVSLSLSLPETQSVSRPKSRHSGRAKTVQAWGNSAERVCLLLRDSSCGARRPSAQALVLSCSGRCHGDGTLRPDAREHTLSSRWSGHALLQAMWIWMLERYVPCNRLPKCHTPSHRRSITGNPRIHTQLQTHSDGRAGLERRRCGIQRSGCDGGANKKKRGTGGRGGGLYILLCMR